MASPSAIVRGLVSRLLPQPDADSPNVERAMRLSRYGDQISAPIWGADQGLADEGSVFTASMTPGQTAIQLGLSASFSATAAAFVIVNSPTNTRRVYLKSLKLSQNVAPTSGTALRYAIALDTIVRAPTTVASGTGGVGPGTPATATAYLAPTNNVNTDISPINGSGAFVYFPLSSAAGTPPTVPAASAAVRYLEGNGLLKGSIPVVLDQYVLQFGSGDIGGSFQAAAALAKIVEHAPAVVIGPGCTALIHIWSPSNITAGNAWDGATLTYAER